MRPREHYLSWPLIGASALARLPYWYCAACPKMLPVPLFLKVSQPKHRSATLLAWSGPALVVAATCSLRRGWRARIRARHSVRTGPHPDMAVPRPIGKAWFVGVVGRIAPDPEHSVHCGRCVTYVPGHPRRARPSRHRGHGCRIIYGGGPGGEFVVHESAWTPAGTCADFQRCLQPVPAHPTYRPSPRGRCDGKGITLTLRRSPPW